MVVARIAFLAVLTHHVAAFRVAKKQGLEGEVNESAVASRQYTPTPSDWSSFQSKPLAVRSITAHDPDSIGWISASKWKAAQWDGRPINPRSMSKDQYVRALCPSVDTFRGLREVFYRVRPFRDNKNPTKAEVDEWHRVAINHLRAVLGLNTTDRQVKPDVCMFARAQWGQERMWSTKWDRKYPANGQKVYGPCQYSGRPAHCGSTFVPDAADQRPYLPAGHAPCGTGGGGSEGIFNGPKSDIPWSIKWSRGFCNTLMAEGICGGHIGPWIRREKFGFSFWDSNKRNAGSNAVLRAKWTGRLMSNPFC